MKKNIEKNWEKFNSLLPSQSVEELDNILSKRIKKTLNSFVFLILFSLVVETGILFFLIITILKRSNDILYLINNSLLGLITILAFISSILAIKNLKDKRNEPLKIWLENKISLLEKSLSKRRFIIQNLILPVIFSLIFLSIHVYFSDQPFLELFKSSESVFGLTAGFIVGLCVSFYILKRIQKEHRKSLRYLQKINKELQYKKQFNDILHA